MKIERIVAKSTKITLVRPTKEHKEKALEYRQEHFNNGELVINGSELLDKLMTIMFGLKQYRTIQK